MNTAVDNQMTDGSGWTLTCSTLFILTSVNNLPFSFHSSDSHALILMTITATELFVLAFACDSVTLWCPHYQRKQTDVAVLHQCEASWDRLLSGGMGVKAVLCHKRTDAFGNS